MYWDEETHTEDGKVIINVYVDYRHKTYIVTADYYKSFELRYKNKKDLKNIEDKLRSHIHRSEEYNLRTRQDWNGYWSGIELRIWYAKDNKILERARRMLRMKELAKRLYMSDAQLSDMLNGLKPITAHRQQQIMEAIDDIFKWVMTEEGNGFDEYEEEEE